MVYGWIALGGAIGAMLRYAMMQLVRGTMPDSFPYATLLVNVSGSFLIGVLFAWLYTIGDAGRPYYAFLVVGVLGSFTTFSTFSLEAMLLLQKQLWLASFAYILSSVLLSLAGVVAGSYLYKLL